GHPGYNADVRKFARARAMLVVACGLLACRAAPSRPSHIIVVLPYGPVSEPLDESAALRAAGFPSDAVGYLLVDATNGAELVAYNADVGFMAGSVAKVASCAAALEVLGP